MVTFAWEHLSDFQRLLLIRILKPQSLTSSTRQFVEVQMGARFVSFGAADLSEMYEKSDAKTPLIFILSSGDVRSCSPCRQVTFVCVYPVVR